MRFKVSKINIKHRPSKYGVRWSSDGLEKNKFFEKERDRNFFYNSLKQQQLSGNNAILRISADDAIIIEKCIKDLGGIDNVYRACQEFKNKAHNEEIKIREKINQWMDEASNLKLSYNHTRKLKVVLERFNESFEILNKVTKDDAQSWINSLCHYAPITVRNHYKSMKLFYNWNIDKGYIKENPFEKINLPKVTLSEPEFLSVEQMETLINHAKNKYPQTVAYFALNGFAGLRSSACVRLPMDDINFKEKGFLIRAEIAKNNRRVYVDGHPENLWKWLNWAKENAPEGFYIIKSHWDKYKRRIQEETGITIYNNGLRHSFCSYHVALNGDAGKTATLLTHRGNVSILYQHYKGNASRAEAEKYFDIIP